MKQYRLGEIHRIDGWLEIVLEPREINLKDYFNSKLEIVHGVLFIHETVLDTFQTRQFVEKYVENGVNRIIRGGNL